MRQEALVQMLGATPRWDPDRGVPLEAYLYRIAIRAISRHLWRQIAPVSGSVARVRRAYVGTVPLDEGWPETPTETEEERCLRREIAPRVQARVASLARRGRDVEFGLRALLSGETPRDLARTLGVPVETVYRCIAIAREHARGDRELHRLWSSREEGT